MLVLSKGSNKIYKSSLIETNSQNSHKDLIEKDKKLSERYDDKKNKTVKVLKSFDIIEVKEEKKIKIFIRRNKNCQNP